MLAFNRPYANGSGKVFWLQQMLAFNRPYANGSGNCKLKHLEITNKKRLLIK